MKYYLECCKISLSEWMCETIKFRSVSDDILSIVWVNLNDINLTNDLFENSETIEECEID